MIFLFQILSKWFRKSIRETSVDLVHFEMRVVKNADRLPT